MNVARRKPMSFDEFLAWEREQELRYEFDGFQPVAMTGGTVAHSEITTNVVEALRQRLQGKPSRSDPPEGQPAERAGGRAFRGDLKIIVADRIRYPDAVITCIPVASDADIVPEPVVVFEVLSRSTASTDRITKNGEYRLTPSIQHYVMLEQTSQAATIFSRSGDDWVGRIAVGDAVLAFPQIGIELPLDEAYAGIEFPDPATEHKPVSP